MDKPTKGLKRVLEYLGEPYEIRMIDQENVIYRDLGEDYDLEVSGLDHNRKAINAIIYVWRKSPGLEIMDIYEDIHSLLDLKDLLGSIAIEHRSSNSEKPLYVKSR